MPDEKEKIEKIAKEKGIDVLILPRIGTSIKRDAKFIDVMAFQMMGLEKNGNTCPFLDTNSGKKSPHGGYPCSIYENRPLACQTYPLIESNPIMIDQKCKFCKEKGDADENLNSEIESLLKIKDKMKTEAPFIWRYATGIGEDSDVGEIQTGWILEKFSRD